MGKIHCSVENCDRLTRNKTNIYCDRHYRKKLKYRDSTYIKNYQHGGSGTRLYKIYYAMKDRCSNKNNTEYHRYGKRGIKVCNQWLGKRGFINFRNDMGQPPSNKHSIDRVNGSLGYNPNNCRWATPQEQTDNRKIKPVNDHIGVFPRGKGWEVSVSRFGKQIYVGMFSDFYEAVGVRESVKTQLMQIKGA